MLHTPTTETKAGLASPRPAEPELSPFVGAFEAPRQPKSPGPFSSYDAVSRHPRLAQLHRAYGNHAILRTINQSHPPSSGGRLQRKCACGGSGPGACDACKQNHEPALQRAAAYPATTGAAPSIVHDVLRSSGSGLDTQTRAFFEPRFGHDFSQVRVHTDARAAESARAVNAIAYAVGNQMVFGTEQYKPQTGSGRRLIAHELTHTVQQGSAASGASVPSNLQIGRSNDSYEQEADRHATQVLRDHPMAQSWSGTQIGAARVQRQDAGSPDAGQQQPDAGQQQPAPAQPAPQQPGLQPAVPAPVAPLKVLRVEVEPGSRFQFSQVPGTGAGAHWVGVASTTAKKPIVRAVLDPAVSATDPRVAALTWSGPDVSPDPANPLQAEVERTAGQRRVTATLGGSSASTTLWAVFAQIKATAGPTPSFSSNATAASPGGTIALQATILPNAILTGDRPALEGPNDTAPPGGTSPATGNPLSGGADHHWDFSRKSRDRVINPGGIPLANFIVPGDTGMSTIFSNVPWAYPAAWEEGNDDSSTGDETNNPYAAPMTSTDTPVDNLMHAAGVDGDTFEDHAQFLEFVRLEINKRWWVISAPFPWRVHMKVKKVAGRWVNNGTDAASDNAGF